MSTVSSGGPSVLISGWLVWILIAGGVASAVLAISQVWIRIIRPVLAGLRTLNDVVDAFTPDHRPTLPDHIHAIEAQVGSNTTVLQDVERRLRVVSDQLEDHLIIAETSITALEAHLADDHKHPPA